ncbi:NAD(P)H-hydrate dehydratase [Fructilactobacillus frigidiflavus]|uniref:NAD(P)H-hydrate dehydratase n=1 Tax=Fructilactobacillus frigidiflavus TaxID=3242688 RepID=UPI003757D374
MEPITEKILTETIRIRPSQSFKGTYGKIALIGGNQNFGGAIIMSTLGAVYAGVGLTTTITDPSNQSSLHNWVPEAMYLDYHDENAVKELITKMDVINIGSGLGTDEASLKLLEMVLATVTPTQILVIDGSAIDLIATNHLTLPKTKIIFTPHQMEWQKLSGVAIKNQNESTNLEAYNRLFKQPGSIVVVKSHRTQVLTPNGAFINTVGTPAQATGGMGDMLAGIIGGFVAQFDNVENAVLAAVYTHSAIADELAKKQYVVLPHQISESLPQFMKKHEA